MPWGLVGTPTQANVLRSVTGAGGTFTDAMTYDPDGSMITRNRNRTIDGMKTHKIETYSYDAFNLVERFTVRKDATSTTGSEGCLPDATTAPLDDFRYRFGPLQEREQKRQYSTSQNITTSGLMWTYTLLGADAKQLATYNGVQGAFCGQPANTLWMWPVEYNSYGPAQTRIITRPQGAKEYVISDHLGSTRLTLNNTGNILQRLDYQPFGSEINNAGDGARTSYIGREKDNESELGFYGVRLYEPEYGRFMSVDALWTLYEGVQPYHYSLNQPVSLLDNGGQWVQAMNVGAQQAIRESVPEQYRSSIKFGDDGILDVASVKEAAKGADVNSNIAILGRLAENESTIEVSVADDFKAITKGGIEKQVSFSDLDNRNSITHGVTLAPRSDQASSALPCGIPFSTSGNIQVLVRASDPTNTTKGSTAAHELFGHARYILLCRDGKESTAAHATKGSKPNKVDVATKRAENEAGSK